MFGAIHHKRYIQILNSLNHTKLANEFTTSSFSFTYIAICLQVLPYEVADSGLKFRSVNKQCKPYCHDRKQNETRIYNSTRTH